MDLRRKLHHHHLKSSFQWVEEALCKDLLEIFYGCLLFLRFSLLSFLLDFHPG